jgi:hypothetical protein
MISYGLLDLTHQRADQASFHIASEKALRIELMRFAKGQQLGPVEFEGDVVVTCLEGGFAVGVEGIAATVLTQVVVPDGEVLMLRCTSDSGAVLILWAPPFAPVKAANLE